MEKRRALRRGGRGKAKISFVPMLRWAQPSFSSLRNFGVLRGDLDDTGLAHRSTLDVIGVHGQELPNVGQGVVDSS